MSRKNLIYVVLGILIVGVLIVSYFMFFNSSWKFTEDRPIKIFWLNSYHEDFFWSEEQINGFRDSFDKAGVDYEIKEFDLNTILNKNEEDWIENAKKAKELIDSWKPDLIYASDDNAQKYVSEDYLNTDLPWVFSGVNVEEKDYDFNNAKNVVGLLERKPILQIFELLREIDPSFKKITIIGDPSLTTKQINLEIDLALEESSGVELVEWYKDVVFFSDLKEKFNYANENSDFVLFLSPERIKYDNSSIVPSSEIVKWRVDNKHIPEVSLWKSFTGAGGFLSVEASAYEHGSEAGELAKQILIEGKEPRSIGSYIPEKGARSINLARAEMLDLHIPSIILINSEVYETFPWEEEE